MSPTLIYLAVPYSSPVPGVKEWRFQEVNKVAAKLMGDGHHIFSPISHTHPIALAGNLPTDWEFWQQYDRAVLKVCSKMLVLTLPGWEESRGVAGEIAIAKEMGIPIEYIEPSL